MDLETIEFFLNDITSIRDSAVMDIAERKDRIKDSLKEGVIFKTNQKEVFTTYLEDGTWFVRKVCLETKKPIAGLKMSFDVLLDNYDIISVEQGNPTLITSKFCNI